MKRVIQLSLVLALFISSFTFKTQDDKLKKSMDAGKGVYNGICMACHLGEGQGIPSVFPPLAKSDYLMKDTDRAIETLIKGLSGEVTVNGTKYNQVMPPTGLDDQDIADVLNYVMNSWGNKAEKMVTKAKVAEVRADLD
ncbi:mono/diheme cytochrome c family protein [Roseivirga pacifica]|uniref:Cytochrome c, mono-and diheme variants n=1 Tax=Roseivirga pacifica TaxID=1267423 RepID=A0A1I0MJ85_9BACT|nr:cytochrome c [Roseivirga pacifica]MCO6358981.1 c-type cytochrome [Roseivirga pacifica]MCO6365383.1 c-type cytochrome [Roseivirga pacifica]MCO6371887.1 c-type cytochrome [Roseivirga pacifica]MCO6376002.1 c-type cytochrome [Roseivirga pacifica]MCO6379265.1 c-type cytochrome [Roseivirga pacifica]|tara:strand:- start:626 stop:1042 length:417 start_codon:yes stop_codon:yes gene_type:complete